MAKLIKVVILIVIFFSIIPVEANAPEARPLPVKKILKSALKKAKREQKNVFIFFTSSWCINCYAMKQKLLEDSITKKIFDANYIIKYIVVLEREKTKHLENPGGNDFLAKYQLGGQTGLPFYIILDENGNLIADSIIHPEDGSTNKEKTQIGRPFFEFEKEAFISLLKKTSTMTENELSLIKERCN